MVRIFVPLHRIELLIYLRALDERVEDIEDGVAAPCVWIVAQELGVVRGGFLAGDAVTVAAEGFELVDEFVYYVPGPEVLEHAISCL